MKQSHRARGLCNGEPRGCIAFGRGAPPSILPDGEGRAMPGVPAELHEPRGGTSIPVLFAGETLWKGGGGNPC